MERECPYSDFNQIRCGTPSRARETCANACRTRVRLLEGTKKTVFGSGLCDRNVAVSFILFHEMFHLMGGHLDWTSRHRGLAHFDEQRLGLAFSARLPERGSTRSGRSDLSTSYVLESEADCNAIQWLLQYAELSRLRELLRSKGQPVTDWAPLKRQTAFRLILAAVWLIIRKLESSRITWLQPSGRTHPLPVTRLFMAFGTFLREYSSISDLEYDEAGGGQRRLTGRDVTSMREFLLHAMGPVLKAD
jgi:hypothetical protein